METIKLAILALCFAVGCAPTPPEPIPMPYPRGVYSDVVDEAVLAEAVETWNEAVGVDVYAVGEIAEGTNIYVGVDDLIFGRVGEATWDGQDCWIFLDVEYGKNAVVLIHELGHCLRLRYDMNPNNPPHNPDPGSVMYPGLRDKEYGVTQTITDYDRALARSILEVE